MTPPTKKQTASRFVELNLNLKVPRKQYPKVQEALAAILDLAGLKAGSEKADKKDVPPKPGRKTKPGKTKTPQKKQAKPATGKRAAASPPSEAAARIRELRTKAGLSQQALANKLGTRQTVVSMLETDKQKLDLDMAMKLGRIFKTPFQGLL